MSSVPYESGTNLLRDILFVNPYKGEKLAKSNGETDQTLET